MKDAKHWSDSEINSIVRDYFEMLKAEREGNPYNKTAHRNILRPKLNGRSNGSIEFKHCNISTVLRDSGFVYIEGYKPRENLQLALANVVNNSLSLHPDLAASLTPSVRPEASNDPFDSPGPPSDDPGERVMQSIRVRRGQAKFRQALLKLYENRCAVTGDGPVDVLEAAHIEPHSLKGRNSIDNGLLLRADIHTLFDLRLLAIDPETLMVRTSAQLDKTAYAKLNGVMLRERVNHDHPGRAFLAVHMAKLK